MTKEEAIVGATENFIFTRKPGFGEVLGRGEVTNKLEVSQLNHIQNGGDELSNFDRLTFRTGLAYTKL